MHAGESLVACRVMYGLCEDSTTTLDKTHDYDHCFGLDSPAYALALTNHTQRALL